jgi:DegV family protein with EDD domain
MKIITDTGSLMSQAQALELDIELLPLQVAILGKNYRDYFELKSADFVEMVKKAIPNSSQPAIGDVMEVYERTKNALHITMTKGLSATYDSALGILNSMHTEGITLFNSKTLAGTQKYLVELAASLSKDKSVEEIVERMNKCLSSCQSFLMPTDFDYLKRGGRITTLAATLGGFLKLKPIVMHVEGSERLEKFGSGRTWTNAIDQIIDRMIENGVSYTHKIYISHAFNLEVAELAFKRIKERIQNIEVDILELSPVMITQGGPGCVAIQYILKDQG